MRLRAAALLLLLCAATGAAAQQNSRDQEQVRRLRQQVQQLQGDQAAQRDTALKADAAKNDATAKLSAAQAELRRLRATAGKQADEATQAAQALEALRTEHTALLARAEELRTQGEAAGRVNEALRGQHAELQRTLAQRGQAQAELEARHAGQARGLQVCVANNQALRDLGHELLQRYLNKTLAEVLAQNEPFLQTKRVQLENLVQGYQDKLDQQALTAAGAAAAAEAGRAP